MAWVAAVGAVLTAASKLKQTEAKEDAKEFQAKQQERQGKAAYATGTRRAYETRRQGRRLESDIRAAQVATGTARDEGALEQLAGAAELTDYNVLSEIFRGETAMDSAQTQAAASRYEGKAAAASGRLAAMSTALSSYSGMSGGFSNMGGSGGGSESFMSYNYDADQRGRYANYS